MKVIKTLRILVFGILMGTMAFFSSCEEDDDTQMINQGDITGVIKSVTGEPVSDVTITVSGVEEDEISVTSDSNGEYIIEGVPKESHSVTFSKDGWLSVSATVTADDFNADNVATLDVTLENASAQISGTVTDAKNAGEPLAGVTVSLGPAGEATTGSDGTYVIENLTVDDYTVTFTKENYSTITQEVTIDDFVDGGVTLDVEMGSDELLRGLTANDLESAEKWYYNEYRGGRNANEYPHWDWACDYMSTLDFQGAWQEKNEGTTLQIRNNEEHQDNPANLEVFDSYVYGSKKITEDNKILSLRVRTHDADESAPAHFGVQVIDLSAAQPKAVQIGETRTYGSPDYTDFAFDLSEYVGKEVIIAVGIYRQQTGDYWKQLVLRAIRFADVKVEGWGWLPGTEVINDWKLTQETVRSTMAHTKSSFTGISPQSGSRDNYVDAYRSWPDVNHIGAEWSFVPLKKDPEPFASEGYVIKTRNTPEVSTQVPEAYFYAKFAISSGNNQFTLNTRNFGDNPTFFKLTAIENDGTVTHVEPQSNTAQEASAADDGCWKFIHGEGSADNPEGYASFDYDLSQFNGSEVTLVLGVYNGIAESGENKLAIHSIELN